MKKKTKHPSVSPEVRKRLFIEAMVANGGNATKAALAAGFKPSAASRSGFRLSNDDQIAAEIQQRLAESLAKAQENTDITVERILKELARIAFADPRKCFDENGRFKNIPDLDDEAVAALAGFEVLEEYEGRGKDRKFVGYTKKMKFWDKNSALEKAMKHLGLFEKDNRQKPVTAPAVIQIVGVASDAR